MAPPPPPTAAAAAAAALAGLDPREQQLFTEYFLMASSATAAPSIVPCSKSSSNLSASSQLRDSASRPSSSHVIQRSPEPDYAGIVDNRDYSTIDEIAAPSVATSPLRTDAHADRPSTSAAPKKNTSKRHTSVSKEQNPVGSAQWLKAKKESHKEVERRRRNLIKEGIDRLGELLPVNEKKSGNVLQEAVNYIRQLKHNEHETMHRIEVERLFREQAILELTRTVNELADESRHLQNQLSVLQSSHAYDAFSRETN